MCIQSGKACLVAVMCGICLAFRKIQLIWVNFSEHVSYYRQQHIKGRANCKYVKAFLAPVVMYFVAQNFDGEILWQILDLQIVDRKVLTDPQAFPINTAMFLQVRIFEKVKLTV